MSDEQTLTVIFCKTPEGWLAYICREFDILQGANGGKLRNFRLGFNYYASDAVVGIDGKPTTDRLQMLAIPAEAGLTEIQQALREKLAPDTKLVILGYNQVKCILWITSYADVWDWPVKLR